MLGSYGFRYGELPLKELYLPESIGRQRVSHAGYRHDGRLRKDVSVLFQYTIAGEGRLELGGVTYRLPAGSGFFVRTVGEYMYYYDERAEDVWEFVWIKLNAEGSSGIWRVLMEAFGPVVVWPQDAAPITMLLGLYADIAAGTLGGDKLAMSERVYAWLLTLLRAAEGKEPGRAPEPEAVYRAKRRIADSLARDVSLEELAAAAGVSKYHLCKLFRDYVHRSPIEYARTKRVEEAARLLRHTRLPIADIAAKAGFDNAGYFGKVFRKLTGMSPSEFRADQTGAAVDSIQFPD